MVILQRKAKTQTIKVTRLVSKVMDGGNMMCPDKGGWGFRELLLDSAVRYRSIISPPGFG